MDHGQFMEFVSDKDGEFTNARFMALAERLYREGRNRNGVALAMVGAAYTLVAQIRNSEEAVRYFEDARDEAESNSARLQKSFDRLMEEDRRASGEAART
jgi:hypothetical protein